MHSPSALRRIFPFLLTALAAVALAGAARAAARPGVVALTPMEQAFLAAHGPVRMCVDPDWEPYERITPEGDYRGIGADLVALVAKRAGVNLELVPTRDWDESIAASRDGRCDILPFLNQTAGRDAWLLFTRPVFNDPNVFITREEHEFISDLSSLAGATVALPSGTMVEERLLARHPGVRVIHTASEAEALRLVSERKADMTLRSLTMAAWTIRKGGWFNLKIAGQFPEYANNLRIGVRRELPLLRTILDKGAATISPEEVRAIVNHHVAIEVVGPVNYRRLLLVLVGLAALALVVGAWAWQTRRMNRRLAAQHAELLSLSRALGESEARFRTLADTTSVGIYILRNDELVVVNPGMTAISGRPEQALLGRDFFSLIHPDDREMVRKRSQARQQGENLPTRYQFRIVTDGDRLRWVELTAGNVLYQGLPAVIGTVYDITEQHRSRERIEHKAMHDPLTGLPNRATLMERLERALARTLEGDGPPLALLFLDLDGFKTVNDTHGHDAGDRLLMAAARRIRRCVRAADTVARIGGDEFVLLLPGVDSRDQALAVAEKVRTALARPFEQDGLVLHVSSSIGVALAPEHGRTARELCACADQAMYRAKHDGRNAVRLCATPDGACPPDADSAALQEVP